MFVDPLAEETMQPYIYVSNNPIRFIDPTGRKYEDWTFSFTRGFLTSVKQSGNGSDIYIVINGKSYNPNSISDQDRKSLRNQILNYVGSKINNQVKFSYKELSGKGGHYDSNNNEIVVTHSTFNQNNIYDLINVIEHEDFHFQNGPVKTFKDHVKVYMQQAGTAAFKKSSEGNKYTNAVATAQRMINSYALGEIDDKKFVDMKNQYNKLNLDYSLKIHPEGNSETTSITVGHDKKHYYYDKNLKPNE